MVGGVEALRMGVSQAWRFARLIYTPPSGGTAEGVRGEPGTFDKVKKKCLPAALQTFRKVRRPSLAAA